MEYVWVCAHVSVERVLVYILNDMGAQFGAEESEVV